MRQRIKEFTLTRPLYLLARRGYLFFHAALYKSVRKILNAAARKKGSKTFRWKGLEITEPWNDHFKAGMIINGLAQYDNMAKMVEKLCQPSPVILDIGAHIGIYSIACSRISGSKVYGFEPMQGAFQMYKHNVTANKLDNVFPFNFGISDICEEGVISMPDGASGSSSFSVEFSSKGRKNAETVSFKTLDGFVRENAVDRIDFIKIRIQGEGHEAAAFNSAHKSIERFRPFIQLIYDPVKYAENGVSTDLFLETAKALNYGIYLYIDINASLTPVEPEEFFKRKDVGTADLMFIPNKSRQQ